MAAKRSTLKPLKKPGVRKSDRVPSKRSVTDETRIDISPLGKELVKARKESDRIILLKQIFIYGDVGAIPVVIRILKNPKESFVVRSYCASALGKAKSEIAKKTLSEIGWNDEHPVVRERCFQSLTEYGPSSFDFLLRVFLEHPKDKFSSAIWSLLSRTATEQAIDDAMTQNWGKLSDGVKSFVKQWRDIRREADKLRAQVNKGK